MLTHAKATLVPMDVARFLFGIRAESVIERVDTGEFRWVWNIAHAHDGSRRELRFLGAELLGGRKPTSIEEAVHCALGGTRRNLVRSSELEILWTCSSQNLMRLSRDGFIGSETKGNTCWLSVESLRHFLTQRLVS